MTEQSVMRHTVLKHGGLRVGVTTYKNTHTGEWRTVVSAYEGDNPSIWSPAYTKEEAWAQHNEAVRMVRMMGFAEVQK